MKRGLFPPHIQEQNNIFGCQVKNEHFPVLFDVAVQFPLQAIAEVQYNKTALEKKTPEGV